MSEKFEVFARAVPTSLFRAKILNQHFNTKENIIHDFHGKHVLVLQDRVFCPDYNNFEDMFEELGFKNKWQDAKSFIAMSVDPHILDYRVDGIEEQSIDVSTWNVHITETALKPEWFEAKRDMARAKEAVIEWAKTHIITKGAASIDKGVYYVYGSTYVIASGSACIYAFDLTQIEARDNAQIYGFNQCVIRARDNTKIKTQGFNTIYAEGHSEVNAEGNSIIFAHEHSSITAYNHCRIEAYDDVRVTAHNHCCVQAEERVEATVMDHTFTVAVDNAVIYSDGQAVVDVYDNAKITAKGSSFVRAYDETTVYAGWDSFVTAHDTAKIIARSHSIIRPYDEVTIDACNEGSPYNTAAIIIPIWTNYEGEIKLHQIPVDLKKYDEYKWKTDFWDPETKKWKNLKGKEKPIVVDLTMGTIQTGEETPYKYRRIQHSRYTWRWERKKEEEEE